MSCASPTRRPPRPACAPPGPRRALVDARARVAAARRAVPLHEQPAPLLLAQQRQLRDRRRAGEAATRLRAAPAGAPAIRADGRRVEQVACCTRAALKPCRRLRRALRLRVELRGARSSSRLAAPGPAAGGPAPGRSGAPAPPGTAACSPGFARGLELLHQLLEGDLLVGVGAQRGVAHARQQLAEGRVVARRVRSTSVLTKRPISPSSSARRGRRWASRREIRPAPRSGRAAPGRRPAAP